MWIDLLKIWIKRKACCCDFFLFILILNDGWICLLNNRRHVCSPLFPLQYTIHTDDTDGNNNIKRPQILNWIFHALRRIRRRRRYDTFARTHLTKTSPFIWYGLTPLVFLSVLNVCSFPRKMEKGRERKRMKKKNVNHAFKVYTSTWVLWWTFVQHINMKHWHHTVESTHNQRNSFHELYAFSSRTVC